MRETHPQCPWSRMGERALDAKLKSDGRLAISTVLSAHLFSRETASQERMSSELDMRDPSRVPLATAPWIWKEPKLQGFDTQPLLAMVKVDEDPSYVMLALKEPAQQSVP